MEKIKIMIFEPGQEPVAEFIDRDVGACSKLIGGPITAKPMDDNTAIIYCDKIEKNRINPNRCVGNAIINGTFFLASFDKTEKFGDIQPYQMQYYNSIYGTPENISKEEFERLTSFGNNEIGKGEMYINNLNLSMNKNPPNLQSIVLSLKGDKAEAKVMLKKMHELFVDTFGTNDIDNLIGKEALIGLPAVCKSRETGELRIGLVLTDLDSSGEHYGAKFVTAKGFWDLMMLKKMIRTINI